METPRKLIVLLYRKKPRGSITKVAIVPDRVLTMNSKLSTKLLKLPTGAIEQWDASFVYDAVSLEHFLTEN